MLRIATIAALVGTLLAGALLVTGPPAAVAGDETYGRTWAQDKTVRPSCHTYRYQYRVTSPTDDWTLETFVKDPTGETVGSGAFFAGADPARGEGKFRLCRATIRLGKYKIRGKLIYYDGYDSTQVWLEAGHFRMRRPS